MKYYEQIFINISYFFKIKLIIIKRKLNKEILKNSIKNYEKKIFCNLNKIFKLLKYYEQIFINIFLHFLKIKLILSKWLWNQKFLKDSFENYEKVIIFVIEIQFFTECDILNKFSLISLS